MNTSKLIESYSGTYQEFYLRHFLVMSAPFIMNWSDDIFPSFSGVSIKQKIPLRMYVGLEKNLDNKILFGKIQYWDNTCQCFPESVVLEYAPYFYDMEDILNEMYSELISTNGGITINILSDLPRSKGLGFESAVSLLISCLMHRLMGYTDIHKLEKLNKLEINEVLSTGYMAINSILGDSFEIDLKIFGKTFYSKKISALFSGGYPVVSFSENNYVFNSSGIDPRFKRFAFRLNEIFPELREVPYSPLDYGLMYTGKPTLLEQVMDKNLTNINIFKNIKEEFTPKFQSYLDRLLPINKPRFYADLLDEPIEQINATYGKMMGIVSLEVLYFMKRLFSEGYSEIDMKSLIKSIEKIRYGNYISRESSESLIILINKMLGSFNENRNLIAVYPNDTSIMGGSLGFVMPTEGFRPILADAIVKIKSDFVGAELFYSNWIDGIEYEGLKIEQDIDEGIFSKLLGDNIFMLTDLDGKRMVGSYDGLIKKITNGLLFDSIHGKIYFDGIKLTSEDIHSQSATIEIVSILMNNLGKDISNKMLPVSRYSKNKNDMIGKIVIPLIEFIEKRTQKRLPLICKGSLYDFYMKLNTSNIPIYFLKKV